MVACWGIERVPPVAHQSNMSERRISIIDSAQQSHTCSDDQWLILVKEALNAGEETLHRRSSTVCIFKVPKILMDINRKAYVPQVVSLGPYHRHCTPTGKLSEIEIHKVRAVHRIISRLNSIGKDINSLAEEILMLEDDIRDLYEQAIECKGKTLAWMLTLDGCFLLEVFRAFALFNNDGPFFEPIFHPLRMEFTGEEILMDIFKLENQIPLGVLRKLLEFQMVQPTRDAVDAELIELLVNKGPMKKFFPFTVSPAVEYIRHQIRSKRHILDLLSSLITDSLSQVESELDSRRVSYLTILSSSVQHALFRVGQYIFNLSRWNRSTSAATDDDEYYKFFPSAEELYNAGINFRACTEETKIRFDPRIATIFLPAIKVSAGTEIIFRNLMAFEACKASNTNIISSYVLLMDSLIDSKRDVALLTKKGIIKRGMGSNTEVAELFNGLGKGITVGTTPEFQKLRKYVKDHYGSKMKVMLAEFRKEQCSRPWRVLSLVAATLLLLMTALQTFFSVYTP